MNADLERKNGLLTQRELAFYHENGYLVKHELFSAGEVNLFRDALKSLSR